MTRLWNLALAFSIALFAAGCSPADGTKCVIGQSIACACSSGATGAQVCEDGSRYGTCSCETGNPSNGDMRGNPSVDLRGGGGKRVFVTRASYSGDLSRGFTGDNIDQLCQNAANGATLGGTFVTWAVSPAGTLPINRLTGQGPWYAVDGSLLFNNRDNLKTSPIKPIELDEFSTTCNFCPVWTGLTSGGAPTYGCYGTKFWDDSRSSTRGRAGATSYPGSAWIDDRDLTCDNQAHLICVEN